VTFTEHGVSRTLLFTPVRSWVMSPWEANKVVAEWLSALQEAIRACTGRTLSVDHSDEARNLSWWDLTKAFFPSAAGCTVAFAVIPLIVYQRLPNRLSELLPGPIFAAAMMAMFLVVRWWQRRSAAVAECDDWPGASQRQEAQTDKSEGGKESQSRGASASAKAGILPAIESWLAIVDGGNYAQSWATTAAYFQRAITKEEWVGRLEKVRRPLDKVLSRKLRSAKFTPDRTLLDADYDTSFDSLAAAVESVTFALQPNGEWKVISYHIKPASGESSGAPDTMPTNKSQIVRIVEILSSITFTSPLAIKLINISALGFLGSLAFLGYVPLPGWQRCFAFSGFSGFFGLIGFAFMVEMVEQRKMKKAADKTSLVRPQVKGPWPQTFKAAGRRLLVVVVVQLTLFETLQQLSVHWKESTGELWDIALSVATLGGLVWACWPGYRLKRSTLSVVVGTIASAVLLLALDNLYFWQLRPALGLYREPDWVAQHPGFQKELRQRRGFSDAAQPTMLVTGTVTDALTGKPIAGARVADNRYGATAVHAPQESWTDAAGRYSLRTWPEEHTVAASASGYETKLATLTTSLWGTERTARMDFPLRQRVEKSTGGDFAGLSFGPVIERVLNDPDDDPRNSLLDLDTGKIFDDPVPIPTGNMSAEMRIGFALGSVESLQRAIRERKVDLIGDASGNSLMGCDLAVVPVSNEQFDGASTETIVKRLNETALTNAAQDSVALHATNTPATWLFKSREGGVGILQITGFTENPRGVKIRYKLVQSSKSN
jgi:hypothetical protein